VSGLGLSRWGGGGHANQAQENCRLDKEECVYKNTCLFMRHADYNGLEGSIKQIMQGQNIVQQIAQSVW
jgi:hypothetical protein